MKEGEIKLERRREKGDNARKEEKRYLTNKEEAERR